MENNEIKTESNSEQPLNLANEAPNAALNSNFEAANNPIVSAPINNSTDTSTSSASKEVEDNKSDVDYSADYKKLKTIQTLGIISLVISFLSLILILIPFGIFLIFAPGIMTFVAGIMILAGDWSIPKKRNSKILWGLLTLLIPAFGSIFAIIFGSK